jgi:nitrogen-specific signal transduction histidine kinase
MSSLTPSILAVFIQVGLGLVVFQANAKRRSNQCFLLLSITITWWLLAVYLGVISQRTGVIELCMRQAHVAGVVYLAVLNVLRLSIRHREDSWPGLLHRSRIWLAFTVGIVVLCQTSAFLKGVQLPLLPGAAPIPIYGELIYVPWAHGFHISWGQVYSVYFLLAFIALIISYLRNLRETSGGDRAELGFILIGAVFGVACAVLLTFVLGFFIGREHSIWLAPFRVVFITLVMAYGIATRKIMEVGTLLRRAISYALLTAYLLAVYALVWWLLVTALPSSPQSHSIAHVAAAIVIAIAMVPARGVSQRLAERLFIQSHQLDFRATVSKAAKILSSVKTLRDLLDTFAETVAEAVGTDRVFILLSDKLGFSQQYPAVEPGSPYRLELTRDQATIEQLESNREPIVLDELHRIRSTPQLQRVIRQLHSLQIALAMGIYARDQLAGILLLGVRKSGRIYGTVEQSALQVLCGQLAVAIENAELFTEVQNAKIYNETLLQSLTSGVIAVGTDERITVFNNEAGEICALNSDEMIDCKVDDLPEALREPLRMALESGQSQVNHEMVLTSGDEALVIRASASIFHGEDRKVLGALMVLTDITSLKRLELQIRRSDRLASLGTLSAGMAHEIKNPLVSIKTFAQLLPERYQDSDFRETFSNLIGHEIERIDTLVNQLLRFARPAKPILKPMHVHEIVQKALQLVDHRMYQKQIKLTRLFDASVDTIRADPDQLEQVFLNFFINAMDAMKNGGELTVRTEIGSDEEWAAALNHVNGGDRHDVLRITIRDTGEGIRGEDLAHVFDPFFTTKDHGTGLGLSVVHGIIQEHGGQIEVESEPQKGTAFHILLPLVRFDREVAAA